jgi:hypothetical protein
MSGVGVVLTAVTTRRTVHLNLASIRSKALRGVLGRDTALEGEASCRDVVLGKTELLERGASSDLDLGGDDIDAGDFFGDGVLDLAAILLAGVHLMRSRWGSWDVSGSLFIIKLIQRALSTYRSGLIPP